MASNPQRVVIELSPARVRLTIARGRAIRARREREVESWDHALELAPSTLAEWTRDLGIKGARSTVVYSSPSARALVHSSPVEAGREQARAEAAAALPRTLGVTQARCIAADWTETAGNGAARVHTLAGGDDADTPARVGAIVSSAGLVAAEIVPATAVLLASATRQLSSLPRSSPSSIILCVGEHACTAAAGDARRIARVRAVELGTRSANTSLLMERLTDELSAITREHPELGPRPALVIVGEAISGEELSERAGLAWTPPAAASDAGPSLIEALASAGPTLIDLAPRDAGEQAGRRVRAARAVGVAAALIAVAVHGASVRDSLQRTQARLARVEMDRGTAIDEAALMRCATVADAQRRAHQALGRSLDAAAAMTLLANASPSAIRFDRLEIDDRGLRARGEVDPSRGGPESMQTLLDILRGSPMVASARLGPAPGGVGPARFELVVELRDRPRDLEGVLATVDDRGEDQP